MSVPKVGHNSVPPTAAGTTAPSTTEKRTTRIANGILRFFKATESGPIRQSVTVGFGVGVFFLGVGGLFGALVGFIHGIFASIKLHNLRVKEKKEEFKNLNTRVQQSINDKVFLIDQAVTLLSDIDKFHDEYNELCIFDDDDMDVEVYLLKTSLISKNSFQKLKTQVQESIQEEKSFLAPQAIALIKKLDKFHLHYNRFYSDNEIKLDVISLKESIVNHVNINGQPEKEYNEKLDLVKERIELYTQDRSFSITSRQATTINSELELLNDFVILGISIDKENIAQLKKTIRSYIQKQVENKINDLNENINRLNKSFQESWSPELSTESKELEDTIKSLKKYKNFLSNEANKTLSRLLVTLMPIIQYGNNQFNLLKKQVQSYIESHNSVDVLQTESQRLIAEIKIITCVCGKEQADQLIESLKQYEQHMITDISNAITADSEATLEALK